LSRKENCFIATAFLFTQSLLNKNRTDKTVIFKELKEITKKIGAIGEKDREKQ